MANRESIEEAAAAWIFKRDAGDWTAADEAGLAAWLEAETAHRMVFLRLDTAWRAADRLKAFGAGVGRGVIPARDAIRTRPRVDSESADSSQPPPAAESQPVVSAIDAKTNKQRRMPSRAVAVRALAATVLLSVTVTAVWAIVSSRPSYHTSVGGLEAVSMADGSQVTLNTDSRIHVAVTERERRVELDRGEAFFEVAKDAVRPFVVVAGDQSVTAVGTKFSVRRDRDVVQVVVSEGRVRVEPRRGGSVKQAPVTELAAGSIARSDAGGLLIQKKPDSEVENYLSWRNGFLVFRGTALREAVEEFNRYNEQRIVIEDTRLAGLQIDGNFRSTNVDAFVRLLAGGFPVEVERRGDRILVRERAPARK